MYMYSNLHNMYFIVVCQHKTRLRWPLIALPFLREYRVWSRHQAENTLDLPIDNNFKTFSDKIRWSLFLLKFSIFLVVISVTEINISQDYMKKLYRTIAIVKNAVICEKCSLQFFTSIFNYFGATTHFFIQKKKTTNFFKSNNRIKLKHSISNNKCSTKNSLFHWNGHMSIYSND